jgi:hypothetical protein
MWDDYYAEEEIWTEEEEKEEPKLQVITLSNVEIMSTDPLVLTFTGTFIITSKS